MKIWVWIALMGCCVLGTKGAEQTGKARRVLAADYSMKRLAIIGADEQVEWEYPIQDIHDATLLENGNLLFQSDWTHVVEVNSGHKVVWEYQAKQNGVEGKAVEIHSFQRLENGLTMIAESGTSRIIEVDKEGKIQHEMKLKVGKSDAHRDTRLVRKLANGNYLVAQEGDFLVREYDPTGKVVWEHDTKAQVYSATRLANGHTLIGCGSAHRVIEVDGEGKEVWTIEKDDLPGITLAWVTMTSRLHNGNTLIVNCHAGPENPQMIEVSAEKKVVWTFHDFKEFGNATPVGLILPEKK